MNIFMVVVTILLALAVQQLIVERERRKREVSTLKDTIAGMQSVAERRETNSEMHRRKLTDAVMEAVHRKPVYEQRLEPKEIEVEKPKEYQRII